MKGLKENIKGLTLIELIISLAIIGIIVIAFMPLFTMSAKANIKSGTMLGSTYSGKDAMEEVYQLSRQVAYDQLGEKLEEIDRGYKKGSEANEWEKYLDNDRVLKLKFGEEDNLINVEVYIYKGDQVETHYQSLFSWKGRGILSEDQ